MWRDRNHRQPRLGLEYDWLGARGKGYTIAGKHERRRKPRRSESRLTIVTRVNGESVGKRRSGSAALYDVNRRPSWLGPVIESKGMGRTIVMSHSAAVNFAASPL